MSKNNGQMTEGQKARADALLKILAGVRQEIDLLNQECDPGDNGDLMSALTDAQSGVEAAEFHLNKAKEVFDPY